VILRRVTMVLAAASMAISPALAAGDASSLSIARAAPAMQHASFFDEDEGDTNHGGGSTAVIIGVILIVLIGVAAISGGGKPNNPHSP
jgi:hypothetical protein